MSLPDKQASAGLGGNRGFSDKAFIFVVLFFFFFLSPPLSFPSKDNPPCLLPYVGVHEESADAWVLERILWGAGINVSDL